MIEKLKSRKFLLAVVSALLIIANDGLGLNLDKDTIMTLASIVISYILGQSFVDAKRSDL